MSFPAPTEPLRRLAVPACILGLALVLLPLAESTAGVWPLDLASAQWRFGAFDVFSRALLLPALGALVLLGLSIPHRRRRLVLGVAFALLALVMCAGLVLFALDALAVRASVRADLLRSFDAAAALAALRQVTAAVLLMGMALAALTPRREARRRNARSAGTTVALVGRSVNERA